MSRTNFGLADHHKSFKKPCFVFCWFFRFNYLQVAVVATISLSFEWWSDGRFWFKFRKYICSFRCWFEFRFEFRFYLGFFRFHYTCFRFLHIEASSLGATISLSFDWLSILIRVSKTRSCFGFLPVLFCAEVCAVSTISLRLDWLAILIRVSKTRFPIFLSLLV